MRRSDAVFFGEVVDVGKLPTRTNETTDLATPFLAPVVFDVKEAWKGVSGGSATVYGQGPEASCGLGFERGETYLVFAYRTGEGEDASLQADYCGNTFVASEDTVRNMLGPPTSALPETGGVPRDTAGKNAAATGAGRAFLAATLLLLFAVVAGLRISRT